MFFILLDQYPILGWILLGAPIFSAFVILRSRTPISPDTKTIVVHSARLEPGDEVQIIHTSGEPGSDDWKYQARFGKVTKSLAGDPRYQNTVVMGKDGARRAVDSGKNFYEIELESDNEN